jgi:hypothetical protein
MAAQYRRQIEILTSARFAGNSVFSFDTTSLLSNTASLTESKSTLGWQARASARQGRTLTECNTKNDSQERGRG